MRNVLDGWVKEGALTQQQWQQWQQQVEVQPFDWRRLARYAFLAALASLVIAFTSLFNDSDLLAWLSGLFRFDVLARMVIASVLAALAYAWALRRRRFHPEKRYGNEAALFIAVLLTACALWQMGVWLDNGSGRVSVLLILATLLYGTIGWFARSGLVWGRPAIARQCLWRRNRLYIRLGCLLARHELSDPLYRFRRGIDRHRVTAATPVSPAWVG